MRWPAVNARANGGLKMILPFPQPWLSFCNLWLFPSTTAGRFYCCHSNPAVSPLAWQHCSSKKHTSHLNCSWTHRGIFSGCIPKCLFTVRFNKFCDKKSYTVLICQWNQIIFPRILQRINIHSLQWHSRWIKSLQQLQLIKRQSSSPHAFSSNVRLLFK